MEMVVARSVYDTSRIPPSPNRRAGIIVQKVGAGERGFEGIAPVCDRMMPR